MAKRRLFSQTITETDAFLDMPLTAQGLYFHLGMNADDDGFVSPRKIMRMIGSNADDLKVLIAKRFILSFDSGVVVIKHWLINNSIRQDRYHETTYKKELATLTTNEFGSYTEIQKITTTQLELTDIEDEPLYSGQPVVAKWEPEVKLSKVKLSETKNKHGDKSPSSEIGKLYYQVIKKYDLPVTNHNVIHAKIRQWEKESEQEMAIKYLHFLLDHYQEIKIKFKPDISTALDIYSKRAMIRNAVMRSSQRQAAELKEV